jgi:hypothetical protein
VSKERAEQEGEHKVGIFSTKPVKGKINARYFDKRGFRPKRIEGYSSVIKQGHVKTYGESHSNRRTSRHVERRRLK